MGSAAAAGGRSDNFQGRKSTISSCQLHLSVSFMSCMCICICQLYLYCGLVCMILSSFESVVSFCVTCVENLSSLKSKFHITAAPKLLSREVFLPADTQSFRGWDKWQWHWNISEKRQKVLLHLIHISIPLICRSGNPVDESTQSRLSRQIEDLLRCVLNIFGDKTNSESETDFIFQIFGIFDSLQPHFSNWGASNEFKCTKMIF